MALHSLTAYESEPARFDVGRSVVMADASARNRIVALFEKHRATPGAPYDEHHFTEFLQAEPKGRRGVLEGFHALRRFNAFIDDVQYEFAICFSVHDRQANDSLQKFVERVIELGGSPHRSRGSWKNQLTTGAEWAATVLADIVLLVAAVWLRDHEWALGALGCLAVLVNAWFVRFAWRATVYFRRLQSRIEAAGRYVARPHARRGRSAYHGILDVRSVLVAQMDRPGPRPVTQHIAPRD